MKIEIEIDIEKAKLGLSVAYPSKDIKNMTDEDVVRLFMQMNKKYGVVNII